MLASWLHPDGGMMRPGQDGGMANGVGWYNWNGSEIRDCVWAEHVLWCFLLHIAPAI